MTTATEIHALQALAKSRQDGLTMFRAIGPDVQIPQPDGTYKTNPEWNDQVSVFECNSIETLLNGGNRSGKSTTAAVHFAAFARNMPVQTVDGRMINVRPEHLRNRNDIVMWIVGLQMNHIGQTIHRLLFRPGLYKIIRDPHTNWWRAFEPWNPWDQEHEQECRPSWPLIPESCIASKVWDNAGANEFKQFTLNNGVEIYAYASTADVKQGDPVHRIWLDERIVNSKHYPEWLVRTTDFEGSLLWSTMTRRGVPAMANVIETAKEQANEFKNGDREEITVTRFVFDQKNNPFLSKKRVAYNIERLASFGEDELGMRIEGDVDFNTTAIYPFYNPRVHCAVYDDPQLDDALSEFLRKSGGMPGLDWTWELILDPGTIKPGVLLCTIPPREFWPDSRPYYVPAFELYRPRLAAPDLAKAVRKLIPNGVTLQRMIIDGKCGRQTAPGFTMSVQRHYSQWFEVEGIWCVETGSAFTYGNPDFVVRSKEVASWMSIGINGRSRLRIINENCPNLTYQLQYNQRKVVDDVVTEQAATHQKDDLRECLEYWASRKPTYKAPPLTRPLDPFIANMQRTLANYFDYGPENVGSDRSHFGPGMAP